MASRAPARAGILYLALSLAACSVKSEQGEDIPASGEAGDPVGMADAPKTVPCALHGAGKYTQDCQVERTVQAGKTVIVLRHPDGGFRRLFELDQGKRFAVADGADAAESTPNGKEIEVTVEDDHYLFPTPSSGSIGTNAPGS